MILTRCFREKRRIHGGPGPIERYVKKDFGSLFIGDSKLFKTCLIDVTGTFPRALFSESKLDVMRWFASKTGSRTAIYPPGQVCS